MTQPQLHKPVRTANVFSFDSILRFSGISVIILASLFARILFLPYITGDYSGFLEKWMTQIAQDGIFSAYRNRIGDYFYPYLYLLGIGTVLPVYYLYTVKFISIFFDYLASYVVYSLLRSFSFSRTRSLLGSLSLLFLPTVLVNGAGWAQSDIIFTTCILFSLLNFIRKRDTKAVLWYAMSFCFKLQAIFVFPAILLFLVKRGAHKLYLLFLIPLMYVLWTIPAVLQGRSLGDALSIYASQTATYPDINLNGFGFYALIGGSKNFESMKFNWYSLDGSTILYSVPVDGMVGVVGSLVAVGIMTIIMYMIYHYFKRFNSILYVEIMLLCSVLVPYMLPRMHERYWFMADVLSWVYVLIKPQQWLIAVSINLASFISYITFFSANQLSKPIPDAWMTLLMIIPLSLIVKNIYASYLSLQTHPNHVS